MKKYGNTDTKVSPSNTKQQANTQIKSAVAMVIISWTRLTTS